MTFPRLLGPVADVLAAAEVPYMLTGSFACAYHGAPRATQDIDLVIAVTAPQVRQLVRLLAGQGHYVDEGAAREAVAHESQFNAIDPATGWKIDFIVRKSRPFSLEEFARRQAVEVDGAVVWIAAVEDVLLSKLEWARLGQSERQLEDVTALLRVRQPELDWTYLERWAATLGVSREWDRALARAGISAP